MEDYILIIDDEEAIRESFKGFLEDLDYNVKLAENGQKGVALFDEQTPMLVLVDLRMPVMNGHEVIQYIKTKNTFCPIIVVSGTGVVEDAIEAVHYGAWDYISKPVNDFSVLTHAMDKAFEKAKLLVENENYKNHLELLVEEKTSELSKANQKLKRQNEELKKAKEKAEENDKLKSAFLANMSHEIRTPMNGIMGFTDLLRNNDINELEKNEYIDLIRDSGNRMLRILNDLIDISKIESGQVELNIEKANVNDTLNRLQSFFKPQTEAKGIEIKYIQGLPDEESLFSTDHNKLYQILTNLIRNAIKFTDKGQITFGYKTNGNILEFFVSDTGIGIKESARELIFKRFVQAENDYSKSFEGAGLGLSISKGFAELLGGGIYYESELGKGSTFYLKIPFKPIDKVDVNKPKPKGKSLDTINAKQILLVEDDRASQFFFSKLLQNKNINLIYASNGKEAIEAVRENEKIDLVFMDIKMPIMSGYEATRAIKEIRPGLPVIIQTAYSMEEQRKRAELAGCDGFILKPVNRTDLFELLSQYLQK